MGKIHSHENLIVWQRSMELVVEIYRWSEALPRTETYGIQQQLRRAAVSIPCNIAEGCARRTPNDIAHFLVIARGSLRELETLFAIVERLRMTDGGDLTRSRALAEEVGKMLNALRATLTSRH
jgi:four helix bundle protein